MKIRPVTLAASLLFLTALSSPAVAQVTRIVDDDGQGTAADCDAATPALTKVGDGIAAAGAGDTVLVCPGTYAESLDFGGKAVTVRSVAGPAVTFLAGNGANTVVTFASGETAASVLEGFTIRSGAAPFGSAGGGIRISLASPVIRGNFIVFNQACSGAGILIQAGAAVIEGNTIERNTPGCGCPTSSGGIGGGGIAVVGLSKVIIRGNTIRDNSTFGDGGGISLSDAGNPVVERNIISGNLGAHGGGIAVSVRTDVTIAGNLIVANRASSGGGIYWLVPQGLRGPLVVNNTIAANESLQGSGVFADGFDAATALYNNNIVAFTGQTAVYCGFSNDLNPPIFRSNNVLSVTGARYAGICTDPTGVNGNNSADPQFFNAAAGDYRLRPASPVVDTGDDGAPGLPEIDLDGRPRVLDGNHDGLARVDIGAYETPFNAVQRLEIDAPVAGNVGVSFVVSGWAIDGHGPGTGVDAVDVWAFPETGGAPTYLGEAAYGLPRADVAAAFGEDRFTNSGFALTTPGVLGTGAYVLIALARTAVTQTFDTRGSVRIVVPSLPILAVDSPADGAAVGATFDLSGWAIDYASLDGPGVDAVHAYAFPASGGAAVFLGAATYGLARPDVGDTFGSPRFAPSGWLLSAALPPGDYQLGVYARSTVAQAFNQVVVRGLKVLQSQAFITIDTPSPGAAVAQPITIAGWAVDFAATTGPGVDAVHAYAFPESGGSPIFLGAAAFGSARPDVAAALGDPRFTNSGYSLSAAVLPPGAYQLAVYARSTVANSFTAVQAVTVTVPAAAPSPLKWKQVQSDETIR